MAMDVRRATLASPRTGIHMLQGRVEAGAKDSTIPNYCSKFMDNSGVH